MGGYPHWNVPGVIASYGEGRAGPPQILGQPPPGGIKPMIGQYQPQAGAMAWDSVNIKIEMMTSILAYLNRIPFVAFISGNEKYCQIIKRTYTDTHRFIFQLSLPLLKLYPARAAKSMPL